MVQDMGRLAKKYWRRWLFVLLWLLILGILVGTAYGHIAHQYEKELTMQTQVQANQVFLYAALDDDGVLQPLEGWEETRTEQGQPVPGSYDLPLLLTNGTNGENGIACCGYDQQAEISLVATSGLLAPENARITLMVEGITYQAQATELKAGSALYTAYGPGWEFRFYDAQGRSLTWDLPGGRLSTVSMTLRVEGDAEYPTLLTLMASARPGDY